MDSLYQNCYTGSGSSQEARDMTCIQGNRKTHEKDFTLENSPGYGMEVRPNYNPQELDCSSFSAGFYNSHSQQVWFSHGHGGGECSSSSHDLVIPNLEEPTNLLDDMENFINFRYTDDGRDVHELLSQNSNILPNPMMNFSGHSAGHGDVLQPLSVPQNLVSNAHPTWNDNVLPMLPFLGHCTTQLDTEIDENSSGETNNYVAPNLRVYWTPTEDELLRDLVTKHGEGKWTLLAKSFPTRKGKNLRERWKNHVKPDINKKEESWTYAEDEILIEAHMQYGNQWSKISTFLPGRTESAVKNHWNTERRKNFSKAFSRNRQRRAIGPLQRYIGIQEGLPAYSTNNTTTHETSSYDHSKANININPSMANDSPVARHNSTSVNEKYLNDPVNSPPVLPGHNTRPDIYGVKLGSRS